MTFLASTLTFTIPATAGESAGVDTGASEPGNAFRIFNDSTSPAHVTWNSSTMPTATFNHSVVGPGETAILGINSGTRYFAAILRDGAGNVFVAKGTDS